MEKIKIIKDNIYGFIPVRHELALKIIDTYEFQRLRFIKQLGFAHFIFPGAQHTRFEHSLGVYHIINVFLDIITNDYRVDNRIKEIIAISGLIHDLGHVAFSHMFDDCIIPTISGGVSHELRSIQLITKMNKKYNLNLKDEEIELIKNIILGKYDNKYPPFIFQIVANKKNELDLDKIDYLLRDGYYLGKPITFDYKYLFAHCKIIDEQICYDVKTSLTIFSLFNMRYELHKKFYNHKTIILYESMVTDAILGAVKHFDFQKMFENDEWINITDNFLFELLKYDESKTIVQNILSRKLYDLVDKETDNTFVITKHIGLTSKTKNPILDINFYDKNYKITKLDMNEISIFNVIHSYEIKQFIISRNI